MIEGEREGWMIEGEKEEWMKEGAREEGMNERGREGRMSERGREGERERDAVQEGCQRQDGEGCQSCGCVFVCVRNSRIKDRGR